MPIDKSWRPVSVLTGAVAACPRIYGCNRASLNIAGWASYFPPSFTSRLYCVATFLINLDDRSKSFRSFTSFTPSNMSTPARRRLMRDFKVCCRALPLPHTVALRRSFLAHWDLGLIHCLPQRMQTDPPAGVSASPIADNVMTWFAPDHPRDTLPGSWGKVTYRIILVGTL